VQERQLTESAEYREILYQKQCGVEKRRGREIAGAKLGERCGGFIECNIPVTRYVLCQRKIHPQGCIC